MSVLLAPDDPDPVEVVPAAGDRPFVLVCEHAGRAVPTRLGDLGVAAAEMDRHIAYDVGAEPLARGLAASLEAELVLQRYSRLVVDCNRPHHVPSAIPATSDGTAIPANHDLDRDARHARFDAIHRPFHQQVEHVLDRRAASSTASILVAVHSFTPRLRVEGAERPWQLGLLFNRDDRFARRLMAALERIAPGLCVAFNQPYEVDDDGDYTIPVHGERRELPHVLLEVRNDQLRDAAGVARKVALLTAALRAAL